MMKSVKLVFSMLLFTMLVVSCTEENVSTSENFGDEATTFLQERSGCGFGGCFELVFPVTVKLPDAKSATYASYEEMKAGFKAWKEANPTVEGRPSFVFPIDVLKADGTMVSLVSELELLALRKECPRKFGKGHGKGKFCFQLLFPYSITKADGTVAVINSKEDIKTLLKVEKGGDRKTKPALVFPVTVKLKDGTTKTVASKEELSALKDTCK